MAEPADRDESNPEGASLMSEARRAFTTLRRVAPKRLSLSKYVGLLQACERPTAAQIESFVDFVAVAHSWYKHLPMHPPGRPFHFFPDPWAGMDIVTLPDGRITAEERVGEKGFHYSWMPTAKYREQFGCLNYHTTAGSSFFLGDGQVVNPLPPAPTLYTPAGPVALPEAVAEAGRVLCTGLIHPYTNLIGYWTWYRAGPWREAEWPAECGGEALKQRIIQRIEHRDEERQLAVAAEERRRWERLGRHRGPRIYLGGGQLPDVLAPERLRQAEAMVNAIRAVCTKVWG